MANHKQYVRSPSERAAVERANEFLRQLDPDARPLIPAYPRYTFSVYISREAREGLESQARHLGYTLNQYLEALGLDVVEAPTHT